LVTILGVTGDTFEKWAAAIKESCAAVSGSIESTAAAFDKSAANMDESTDAMVDDLDGTAKDITTANTEIADSAKEVASQIGTSFGDAAKTVGDSASDIVADDTEMADSFKDLGTDSTDIFATMVGKMDAMVGAMTDLRDATVADNDAIIASDAELAAAQADLADKSVASAAKQKESSTVAKDAADVASKGSILMSTAALAVAGAGYEVVKQSTDYNKQVSLLAGTLQVSTGAAGKYGQALQDLANTSEFATSGSEGLISAYNSVAGELDSYYGHTLTTTQMINLMTQAQELATGTNTNLTTTTQALAAAMTQTNTPLSQVSATADQMFNTSKALASGIGGLSQETQGLQRYIGGLHVPMNQVYALMLDLQHAGINSSQGMRSAGEAIKSLADPTTEQQQLLFQLGVQFQTSTGQFVGMSSIITQLGTALNKLPQNNNSIMAGVNEKFAQAAESAVSATSSVTQAQAALSSFDETNASLVKESLAVKGPDANTEQLAQYVRFTQEEMAATNQLTQLKTEKSTTASNVVKANLESEIATYQADQLALSKTSVATTLFGNSQNLLTAIVGQGAGTFNQYVAQVDKTGTAHKAAVDAASSAEVQFTVFEHQMQSLAITIGNGVIPVFGLLFKVINTTLKPFVVWIDKNHEFVTAVGAVVGSLAGLASAMILMRKAGSMLEGVGNIISHFGGSGAGLQELGQKLQKSSHWFGNLKTAAEDSSKAEVSSSEKAAAAASRAAAQQGVAADLTASQTTDSATQQKASLYTLQVAIKEMTLAFQTGVTQITEALGSLSIAADTTATETNASVDGMEENLTLFGASAAETTAGVSRSFAELDAMAGASSARFAVATASMKTDMASLAVTSGVTTGEIEANAAEQEVANAGVADSEGIMAMASRAAGLVMDTAMGPWGMAIMAIITIATMCMGHWKVIWKTIESVFTAVVHAIMSVVDDVVNFVKAHWMLLLEIFLAPFDPILALVLHFHKQIAAFFDDMWHDVEKIFEDGVHAVVWYFVTLPEDILKAVAHFGTTLVHVGSDLISGLIQGIENEAKKLPDLMGHIAKSAIMSPLKSVLHIFSPSGVMADEIGSPIVQGIAQGLQNGAGAVESAVNVIAKNIISQFSLVRAGITTLTNVMPAFSKNITSLHTPLSGMASTLKTMEGPLKEIPKPVGELNKDLSPLSKGFKDVLSSFKAFNGELPPFVADLTKSGGALGVFNVTMTKLNPELKKNASNLEAADPALKAFSTTMTNFAKPVDASAKNIDHLNTAMTGNTKVIGQFTTNLSELHKQSDVINTSLGASNTALHILTTQTGNIIAPLSAFATNLGKALTPLEAAIKPLTIVSPALTNFSKALASVASSLDKFNKSSSSFDGNVTAMNKGLGALNKAMSTLGPLAATLSEPMSDIVNTFQQFGGPLGKAATQLSGAAKPLSTMADGIHTLDTYVDNLNKPLTIAIDLLDDINTSSGKIVTSIASVGTAVGIFTNKVASLINGPSSLFVLAATFSNVAQIFASTFGPIPNALKPISKSFQTLTTDISGFWTSATSTSKTKSATLLTDFTNTTGRIKSNWNTIFGALPGVVTSAMTTAVNQVEAELNGPSGMVSTWNNAWLAMSTGMNNQIKTMVSNMGTLGQGVGTLAAVGTSTTVPAATITPTASIKSAALGGMVTSEGLVYAHAPEMIVPMTGAGAAGVGPLSTGSGIGGTNVNVYVTGNTVMSEADTQMLATRVSQAITKSLPGAGVHIRH
jgi:TP901 family phage tail tape measure protein